MSIGTSDHDIHALGTQCTLVIENRMIAVHSKNEVIPLPIFGEICLGVINDVVCPNRAHHVHIARAAHGSDASPERFGKLHRKRPHPTRRTINQHLLSRLYLSFRTQTLQGGDCCERDGCCLLECHIGRFQRECIFTSTHILGKSAPSTPGQVPEYLITWPKLRDVPANRFHAPRQGSSEYLVFWFEKPIAHEAHQERFPSQEMPLSCIDGCRMNFYQDFIVLGSRFCYLFELKHIR